MRRAQSGGEAWTRCVSGKRTVNRFFDPPADGGPNFVFEGPGRDNKAFPPPTLRVPSLIALEEEVNGSGAATFESFCSSVSRSLLAMTGVERKNKPTLTFSHLLQTMV